MRKESSTNYRNELELVASCPLAAALKIVGGRWKPMIVWYVAHGLNRYGRLRATIPNISEKMLYQQLRELTRDGLLARRADGRRVEYELTPLGQTLLPILASLEVWSRAHGLGARWVDGAIAAE